MDGNGVVVGLVSFGWGGCASDYPDVYTKVSTYSDWIREQITAPDDNADAACVNSQGGTGHGFFETCFAYFGYYSDASRKTISSLLAPWN